MSGGYCCPFFNNAGTVSKGAGTGTTRFDLPFTNSGAVIALTAPLTSTWAGTLMGHLARSLAPRSTSTRRFQLSRTADTHWAGLDPVYGRQPDAGEQHNSESAVGGGTVTLGSGFQGGTITNLTLAGASLSGNNTVSGLLNWSGGTMSGSLLVAGGGTANWSGGGASGPVTIATNGVLNLIGGGSVTLYAPLTNAGTINWSNSITWYVYNDNASYHGAIYNLANGC